MIQIKQPTLNNFSVFQKINLFDNNVKITTTGIVHVMRETCPDCGEKCHYNGSSNKGRHILSKSYNSFLRKGQQYCSNCKKTIQVENDWIDIMITNFNDFITTEVCSLAESMSEDDIVNHFYRTKSMKISKSLIHAIITKANAKLAELEFETKIEHEFYGYDEQYVKIDGQRAYRLVFYDLKHNKVLHESTHKYFSKKILQKVLIEVFRGTKPKGFVTDMRVEYPSAFKSVFGRNIRIQYCVFHLNKLILKEYADSLRIGNKVQWTIMDYYNLYSLFNIFYDRSYELRYLKKMSEHFDKFKMELTSEKIKFYAHKYNLPFKKEETLRRKVVIIIQAKMIKSFRIILKCRRVNRKRLKITLIPRSIESAKEMFANIQQESFIFPVKIQKRIKRTEDNFEYFTASKSEILTNNKLEGFFGATLKKFRKKIKRSMLSFRAMLNSKRARREGLQVFRKFNLFELTQIFTTLSFFA